MDFASAGRYGRAEGMASSPDGPKAVPVEPERSGRRRRTVDERLMVRFPSIYRALASRLLRSRPPSSRLRRSLMTRSIAASFAGFNRGDFRRVFIGFADEVDYRAPAGVASLGAEARVHGRDELEQSYVLAAEGWDEWAMTPAWMLDLGETLVVLSRNKVRGRVSGLRLDTEWASVYEFEGGLVARQWDYLSWEEALDSVGLGCEVLAP
jgi:ketosteroid isomerase-like protein